VDQKRRKEDWTGRRTKEVVRKVILSVGTESEKTVEKNILNKKKHMAIKK
jgi:hypothetical protein